MKKVFIVFGIMLISQCAQGITPINVEDDAFNAFFETYKTGENKSCINPVDMAVLINRCQKNRYARSPYYGLDCNIVIDSIDSTLAEKTTKRINSFENLASGCFFVGTGILSSLSSVFFFNLVGFGLTLRGIYMINDATWGKYISPEAKQQLINIRDNIQNVPAE